MWSRNKERPAADHAGRRVARGVGRRVLVGIVVWCVALVGVRLVIARPEHCGSPGAAEIEGAVERSLDWFERNQHDDGSWLYGYDVTTDTVDVNYNIVRHAGVTMSLYQAARAGFSSALPIADRGAEYALERLLLTPSGLAFADDSVLVPVGATALLLAGLLQRRIATDDGRYDALLVDTAEFLASQIEADGSVLAYYNRSAYRSEPGEYSKYYTGETFWALAMMHAVFADDGFDADALRIGEYLADGRDDKEQYLLTPDDHWAAYGYAEMLMWPEPLTPTSAQADYLHQVTGMLAIPIVWLSQSGGTFGSLRGDPSLAGLLGNNGEGLAALALAAQSRAELADIAPDPADHANCAADILIDRQHGPGAGQPDGARYLDGAWVSEGTTRMDYQQHALSALLGALRLTKEAGR